MFSERVMWIKQVEVEWYFEESLMNRKRVSNLSQIGKIVGDEVKNELVERVFEEYFSDIPELDVNIWAREVLEMEEVGEETVVIDK